MKTSNVFIRSLFAVLMVFALACVNSSHETAFAQTPTQSQPAVQPAFDGKVLYKKAFEALRDLHITLQDPAARAKWVAEWENKHATDGALSTEEGTDKAIDEMVASLGQRFDGYANVEERKAQLEAFDATLVGIGTTLKQTGLVDIIKALPKPIKKEDFEKATVISDKTPLLIDEPFEQGPAEKAGLKPGDRIVEVDGKAVDGKSINAVVATIRGKSGTTVKIKVRRASDSGASSDLTFDIVRAKVVVKAVKFQDLGNGISYVKLRNFTSQFATKEMTDALNKAKNGKALILDLRGNPGGRLDFVEEMSQYLLEEGTLLVTKNRAGDVLSETKLVVQKDFIMQTQKRSDKPGQIGIGTDQRAELIIPDKMPVIVLVDEGSASASEILAGLLQKNKRAIIVGETTLGKGVGQTVVPLPFDRSISVTSFEFMPGGEAMDWVGVIPNIEVARGDNPKNDLQLDAAKAKAAELVTEAEGRAQKATDIRKKHEDAFKKMLEEKAKQ